MTAPSWRDVLPTLPPGAQLEEAWITTFDQPDSGLLVEHFLPLLLGLTHSLSQETQERALFFGELGTTLEALHGRLTVISSPPREEREPSQYPWLWRYVSHFMVGAASRAVQHAKLWAFHWTRDEENFIELHISSTNLTSSAFKEQMQAGWNVSIPLGTRSSLERRRSWGPLIPFLAALGASAGTVAATRMERLVSLLGRAQCPNGVQFVTSVPGTGSAARQLRTLEASEIHILVPTIGEWDTKTLSGWATDANVPRERIYVKWIAAEHPWAQSNGWTLSQEAKTSLEANNVKLQCLANDARLAEQHHDADPRWSHAKLYLLRRRAKRHLLVTSANWSPSAWGAGNRSPRNFELGVVFESTWTELERMRGLFDPPHTVAFCTAGVEDKVRASPLEWAEATWDGASIQLHARSSDGATPISAAICFANGRVQGSSLQQAVATIPWSDPEDTPLTVRFIQGPVTLDVHIVDLRQPVKFARTPLPELDPAVGKSLREAFLLQRYGGPMVDSDSIPGVSKARPRTGAPAASYAMDEWVDARNGFHVVDRWRAALSAASNEPTLRDRVRLDGEELRALYARRPGPAAALVAEELHWWLRNENDERLPT